MMASSYDYYVELCKTPQEAQKLLNDNKDLPAFYLFSHSANSQGLWLIFGVRAGTSGVKLLRKKP